MANLLERAPPALTSGSAHPHTLTLVHTGGALLKCDGCQQCVADEAWYRCDPCNFDLHLPCALAQSAIAQARFGGCCFTFFNSLPSPGAGNSRICDACGDHVLGFLYHSQGGLDLHPCCASLKETIVHNGRELNLCNQAAGACNLCGQDQKGPRGKFWTYASFNGNGGLVNMHVACLLYGDQNRHPGPGTDLAGTSRSISTSSSVQTAFTPTQMMNPMPIPGQMMNPGPIPGQMMNAVATVQTFNTFYTFGKILKEIAHAFTTGHSTDTLG